MSVICLRQIRGGPPGPRLKPAVGVPEVIEPEEGQKILDRDLDHIIIL
jgi:hypothetical protein